MRVNCKFLKLAFQYLGPRVAVPTLEVHIESFYDLCGVPCNGPSFAISVMLQISKYRKLNYINLRTKSPHLALRCNVDFAGLGCQEVLELFEWNPSEATYSEGT